MLLTPRILYRDHKPATKKIIVATESNAGLTLTL